MTVPRARPNRSPDQVPTRHEREIRLACCRRRRKAPAGNRVGPSGGCRHDGFVNVEEINIGPSEALMPAGSVAALAGKALRGDRHFRADGAKPGQALTLIEAEALEDVA